LSSPEVWILYCVRIYGYFFVFINQSTTKAILEIIVSDGSTYINSYM